MNFYRSNRICCAFMGMVLLLTQLAACSLMPATATQVAAGVDVTPLPPTDTAVPPTATVTRSPVPTRTLTPSPSLTPTRTITATITPTPNIRETYSALTEAATRTICSRYPDTWQMTVERAFQPNWCKATGVKGSLYEYEVFYPSEWSIKAFGDLYRHLLFVTGRKNTELRLYQVFSYYTRKETYKLEEAPLKAVFYDQSEKAFSVMNPLEKIVSSEMRTVYTQDVMVVDSLLGDLMIRRYFFFEVMYPAPSGMAQKHLFYLELSALKTLDPVIWQDLIEKTEYIMTSVNTLMGQ